MADPIGYLPNTRIVASVTPRGQGMLDFNFGRYRLKRLRHHDTYFLCFAGESPQAHVSIRKLLALL
jgi:hypothetical protein